MQLTNKPRWSVCKHDLATQQCTSSGRLVIKRSRVLGPRVGSVTTCCRPVSDKSCEVLSLLKSSIHYNMYWAIHLIHGIKCIAQKLTSCNTAAVSLQLERKTERTREVKTVNQRERTGSAAYNKIRPIIFIRNIAPYQNCNNRTAASNILLVACMNFN